MQRSKPTGSSLTALVQVRSPWIRSCQSLFVVNGCWYAGHLVMSRIHLPCLSKSVHPASHENCYCIQASPIMVEHDIDFLHGFNWLLCPFPLDIYLVEHHARDGLVLDQHHPLQRFHCPQTFSSTNLGIKDLISILHQWLKNGVCGFSLYSFKSWS